MWTEPRLEGAEWEKEREKEDRQRKVEVGNEKERDSHEGLKRRVRGM